MRQRVRVRRGWLVVAAAVVVAAGTACGSSGSTNPGLTAAELVGTYNMSSITIGTGQPIGPPEATGVLELQMSTYNLTLILPNSDTTTDTTADNGTWTVNGHNWAQTSSVNGEQETGTVSLSHDTLSVNLTAAGVAISTVWLKQP